MDLGNGMQIWQVIGAGVVGLWTGGVLALTQLPETRLTRPLRGFVVCAALWALGDLVAGLASDLFWKQVGIAVLYSGAIFLPPLWWMLAVRWAETAGVELPPSQDPWTRVPLVFAGVMWLLMLANPWHGAFLEPVVGGRNVYGPLWFWMAVPEYGLILGVLALDLWVLWRVRRPGVRRQAVFMIVASGFTLATNCAYVAGVTGMNATLPVLAVAGMILTIGMLREGLFGVLPVALPVIASHDPDGLAVVRPDGALLYANQRARAILGPATLAAQMPLLAVLAPRLRRADGARVAPEDPPSDADREESWWRSVLEPGGALHRYTDGDERWLRISAQRVTGRRERLRALCLRIHDATDEQRAEIELRRARRLESVAEVSAGVAHDFHNLLAVVGGNAELLAEELPAEPALQRKLHRIRRAGEQAMALADQLQLQAGAAEPARARRDLSALVQEVSELFDSEVLAPPRGETFHLELDLACQPLAIEADATQLRQLVQNLLVNAREALAGEGGRIRVATGTVSFVPGSRPRLVVGTDRPAGRYVYLRVADTGAGMDAATQERIFEPFFSTKGKRRGLGLSTVFGIVRSHDALLELESQVGQGTAFSVYFPCADEEPAGPDPSEDGAR